MRREIPLLITAVVGLFMILSFFIPNPLVTDAAGRIKEWFLIIAAFAVVLGVGNLIRVNVNTISRKGDDWGFKIVLLFTLFAYLVMGLVLDVNLDIRTSVLTRALGLVEPDEKKILEGRQTLPGRKEEVAAILEAAATPEEGAATLTKELGIDPKIVAPDLAALGAAEVRALDSRAVYAELEEERGKDPPWQRQVLILNGRFQTAGLAPVVIDTLGEAGNGAPRALMVRFAFTLDQANDLVALGPAGVSAVTLAAVQGRLDEIAAQPAGEKEWNAADWVFKFIYTPLNATMFSLLAFFIASAAFRAFRMHTVEAGLLLVSGLLVIVGRVPIGQFDWGISESDFGFHIIMQWIMNVPNTAAMRGILMGAAMGVIVMGLKVILGIERSYLGGGDS